MAFPHLFLCLPQGFPANSHRPCQIGAGRLMKMSFHYKLVIFKVYVKLPEVPSDNLLHSYWKLQSNSLSCLLDMVGDFPVRYVSLPEANPIDIPIRSLY